jgi:tetratricopeptide (TPR) repeat protein
VDEHVGRSALVTAPAGAGKSRLRHELVQRFHKRGSPFTLLIGRGDSVRAGTPFGLLGPAIRAWADIENHDTPDTKRKKLKHGIARLLPGDAAGESAGFLGEMAGVPFADEGGPQLRAARRDPQLMGDRLLSTWLSWLDALSARQPLVFLAEDLHWADQASVRFLESAQRSLANRAFLVIAFARPEVNEVFPRLWSERDLVEIRLPKLGARACERLLDALDDEQLTPEVRAWLIERADGNPFFLEELVRGLRSRGEDRGLPDSVLGMIQARLDALGEDAKLLLRAASVFGQMFREEALEALLGEHAERLDLSAWLQLLSERELIFPKGESSGREYVVRHALIRDAAYALLPDDDRSLGHRLAGEWLEAQGVNEPALLADHFELGGIFARAASCYRAAAIQALEASSLSEVARFGERAVACGAEGQVLGEVSSFVAEALSYSGDDAGTSEWALLAQENLDPGTPAWWRASQVLAIAHLRQGSPEASDVIESMIAMTADTPSLSEQVIALAFVAFETMRLAQHELGHRVLSLLPAATPEHLAGRPEGCVALARLVHALSGGNLAAAARHARSALEAYRRVGAMRDTALMLSNTGSVLCELGAHEEAERYFLEMIELGQRLGVERWIVDALGNLGMIYLRRSELENAERVLGESAAGFERIEMRSFEATALLSLAQAVLLQGDAERAAKIAARALELSAADPSTHAPALATLSRVELARGRAVHALSAAEKAIALLHQHQLFENVAIVRMMHVESLLACGRAHEARAAIAEARTWLHERADKIDDAALQRSFLTNIPENARLLQLASEWLTPAA